MNQLTVIRASAGSGKTHQLTGYYLNLLMLNGDKYYSGILAVTFTNKATAEMKQRIIQELYKLGNGEDSVFISELRQQQNLTEQEIRNKAHRLLINILHDYSWFSVETIDTFFQRLIRAFSREIGLPGNYALELDPAEALEYAVDQLIDTSGSDATVISWLTRYSLEKIGEGKGWDVKNELLTLGGQLFNEVYIQHSDAIRNALANTESITSLRDNWFKQKTDFENRCNELGREGIYIIENAGLNVSDFFNKRNGIHSIFKSLLELKFENSNGQLIPQRNITLRLLESADNWAVNGSKNEDAVRKLASQKLLPHLRRIINYLENAYIKYATIKCMLSNLFPLGLLLKLNEKLTEYRLKQNSIILSDATALISKLVRDNDASFIYEKMGNRYRNFLIDEFQDTSVMQWLNFKPLIDNSLSQAYRCLLVGDVKQSIYRWRNSEWDILASKITEQYSSEVLDMKDLITNWRSCREIIDFNNTVFPVIIQKLSAALSSDFTDGKLNLETEIQLLQSIYGDVRQEVSPQKPAGGCVQVKFFNSDQVKENPHYYRDVLVRQINELMDKGYNPGDIAVLVRYKKEGKRIAETLIELNEQGAFHSNIQIISNESLFLNASPAVQLLVAAIEFLSKPGELLYRMRLVACFTSFNNGPNTQDLDDIEAMMAALPEEFTGKVMWLRSLPLYELAEYIADIFKLNGNKSETPYIHSFFDIIHEFTLINPASINKFLEYWDEKGKNSSLNVSEAQNAIRIVTIHKSKGLEFRAVIIPFCNWNLDQKVNSLFWVTIPDSNITELPVYPVNYTKALKNTVFFEDYYREKFRSFVDNVNTLYVAMTRARENIFILSEFRSNGSEVKTVGDLLYSSISSSAESWMVKHYNHEEYSFLYNPTDTLVVNTTQSVNAREITQAVFSPAMDRLFFNTRAMEYFNDETRVYSNMRVRGKRLHGILANMQTCNDVDNCITMAIYQGLIEPTEGAGLKKHIEHCMQLEQVLHWFDGSGRVLNERELLLPDGKTKRPDRVVVWDDQVHVVDYKFGSDRQEPGHRRQVNEYITILTEMGYPLIKGYLWYIDMNDVIEI